MKAALIYLLRIVGMTMLFALALLLPFSFFSPFGGLDLIYERFIFGFWFFLRDSLPAISWDAGTWGPGLAAFLLAALLVHRPAAAWAARSGRHWSVASTMCLALAVPVLFVVAFIVPGVLLQWEMLRQTPWVDIR